MKTRLKMWLISLSILFPPALIVLDRVVHAFGICLGH